jgi:N-acetyl-gamma-glutamyl-phosphate reductase
MSAKIQAAILGATGYTGFELFRILRKHPHMKPVKLYARESAEGTQQDLVDVYPHLSGDEAFPIEPFSWAKLHKAGVDLLFLATPHEVSRSLVPEGLSRGLRIVDLSGAWRLKQATHRKVYGFEDSDPSLAEKTQQKAVFGIPELHGKEIANAALVANAGCYATANILAIVPLVNAGVLDEEHGIICDSKSGVSGAGKQPTAKTHFVEVANNLSAYSVFQHRHTGEILEQTGLKNSQLVFTPHLLPIPRGILSTIYMRLNKKTDASEVLKLYREFYAGKKFIRVYPADKLPQIQYSIMTNFCDIGFALAEDSKRLIVVSCLDNLLKGASGQAIQNMNVMYGWDETAGLA